MLLTPTKPPTDDDMKMKCKMCDKKFKLRTMDDLDCKDNCCALRYNMITTELSFGNYLIEEKFDIITDIKSETPVIPTMTEEEWCAWAEQNWPTTKKDEQVPFDHY